MAVTLGTERKGVEVKWTEGIGDQKVTVYAQGEDGKWHNTAEMKSDGYALLAYPADFKGSSLVEVRAADGSVLDSGTIKVG